MSDSGTISRLRRKRNDRSDWIDNVYLGCMVRNDDRGHLGMTYICLEDLLRELDKRKVPSRICEESTVIMTDVLRAIENCRKEER